MIFSSIDTLHVIYYNYTMEKIFKHLGLSTDNIQSLYEIDENGYCKNIKNRGYTFEFKLNYNNIWFHGDCATVEVDSLNCNNFFTFEFKKIRVEFTGEGIEFLRLQKFSPDDTFINHSFWLAANCQYHITRVDFAFDYVNEKADVFDGIFTFVDNFQLKNRGCDRLYTGRASGISFKRKYGNEDTLYLGSQGSDKICRIYDKMLERGKNRIESLDLPIFMIDDIEHVNSWYRVELQFRRNYCSEQLFCNHGDLKNNLMFLFHNFMLCEKDDEGKYHHIQPMKDLYDWTKLQQLYKMQNTSRYKEVTSHIAKAHEFICTQGALSSIYVQSHGGLVAIVQLNESGLSLMQCDENYKSRLITFNSRAVCDADKFGYSLNEWLPYLKEVSGQYVFDYPKMLKDLILYLSLNPGVKEVVVSLAQDFKGDIYNVN